LSEPTAPADPTTALEADSTVVVDSGASRAGDGANGIEPSAEELTVTGFHLPQRTKMLIMGGAMLALFLSSMEQTVVSTALPRIVSDLDGLHLIAWVVTAFLLASVTVVPVAGRLSDIYGRKPLLLVGLTIFLVGSALAGFAQNMTMLIVFRGIQGFGAGILMANTMAISGDLFPPSERGKYMGLFAGIFGISAIIGPSLGGFLTDQLSWRWVFWINLPLGVFSVLAILFFMPWIRPPKRKVQIDYTGVAALVWTLVPALLALALLGTTAELGDLHIIAMFLASVVGLVVFILNERRVPEPIVPLELFKVRTFSTAAIVMFGMGIGVFGVIFFIPLFVQGVVGKTATESGAVLTPQMLAVVFTAALSGQIMSRTGRYKFMALTGVILLGVAVATMTQLNLNSSLGDVIWRQILFGAGMGMIFPVMMLAVQNAVPQRYLGTASSSTQFFQSVGGLVGITVFGTLLNKSVESDLASRLPAEIAGSANAQQLLDPAQRAAIVDEIGPDAFVQIAIVIREALADAITGNFWISLGVIGVIFVAMLQLKELKLRGADQLGGAEEIEAAADDPDGLPAAANPTSPPIPALALATAEQPAPADPDSRVTAPARDRFPLARGAGAGMASAGSTSKVARLLDTRVPELPLSRRRRGEVLGALVLGSLLGLAASVSARNGNGNGRRVKSEPSWQANREGRMVGLRRRGADLLDPPEPERASKRGRFF